MKKILDIKENLSLVHQGQNLFLVSVNEIYDLQKSDFSLYLLPILELDYDAVRCKLNNYNTDLFILNVLKFPFDNKMAYWSELSLNWITLKKDVDSYKEWANKVDLHWMPQRLKHRFIKTLKPIRAEVS